MISDALNLNEAHLLQAIHKAQQERNPFSTTDVIRFYSGSYHVNNGTPVNVSLNAEIGRFLSRNSKRLRLVKQNGNVKDLDENGNETTTAMWSRRSTIL